MSSRLIPYSERKFTLRMNPRSNGVRLKDCTLELEVYVYTNKSVMIDKSYIKRVDDDSVDIILVMEDAKKIGAGNVKVAVHIGIPDKDFPDGYCNQRYEVWMN